MPEEKKMNDIPTPLIYKIDLTDFEEDNKIDYEEGIFNLNENVFYISSFFLVSFNTFHLLE
jgi:hypothetical protein